MAELTVIEPAAARTGRVVWTAKEAIACAYCWAEFSRPEETQPHTTPAEIDEAVCVVVGVAADYGRNAFGAGYLAQLADVVRQRRR